MGNDNASTVEWLDSLEIEGETMSDTINIREAFDEGWQIGRACGQDDASWDRRAVYANSDEAWNADYQVPELHVMETELTTLRAQVDAANSKVEKLQSLLSNLDKDCKTVLLLKDRSIDRVKGHHLAAINEVEAMRARVVELEGERDEAIKSLDWVTCERDTAQEERDTAQAEVRALCGEPEALDPYLPEGWRWDGSEWARLDGAAGCAGQAGRRGLFWYLSAARVDGTTKSPLAAMRDADAALEGSK